MAASCMGAFGTYKLQYADYLKERQQREGPPPTETVWVTRRYAPTDERVTAPVPRFKHLVPKYGNTLKAGEDHWIPASDPPLACFNRSSSQYPIESIYIAHPATRSEEWSTLRQMLPSYGNVWRGNQPNWGTSYANPPTPIARLSSRFPKVNSTMTKYVDEMHKSNRQFRHC